jgi:uncharacterized protein YjbJ (UPF0337 family)
MDKNRVKGMADQAKGAIKDAAGKLTGNTRLRAEGKVEKVKGKLEDAAGRARDALRKTDADQRR